MEKRLQDYSERHIQLQNYLIKTLVKREDVIDPIMEGKDMSSDFNLKIPHLADIIYSVILEKKLEKSEALKFITIGSDNSGNPKAIDTELANAILTIDKLTNDFKELIPGMDTAKARKTALATFPDSSQIANKPLNPSLSKVSFLRHYLSAMIEFCSEKKGNSNKNCFIATVVYGDINHPNVEDFRKYRDEKLVRSKLGRGFIDFYYKISPSLSKRIGKSKILKFVVLKLLDLIRRGL